MIEWSAVAAQLQTAQPFQAGYSNAGKQIVTMSDGQRLLVKQAFDEQHYAWLQKEVAVYTMLAEAGFTHTPALVAYTDDSIAIDYLGSQWDFTPHWTTRRLNRTLAVLDELADIAPVDTTLFQSTLTGHPWTELLADGELQDRLRTRCETFSLPYPNIASYAQQNQSFVADNTRLTHYDMRADNCAYNRDTGDIKIIDWNWTCLGDRRIDVGSLLVSVQCSGLDISQQYADRLDPDALLHLAGYYLTSAATPIWEGGNPKLRDLQLSSGMAALWLAKLV